MFESEGSSQWPMRVFELQKKLCLAKSRALQTSLSMLQRVDAPIFQSQIISPRYSNMATGNLDKVRPLLLMS